MIGDKIKELMEKITNNISPRIRDVEAAMSDLNQLLEFLEKCEQLEKESEENVLQNIEVFDACGITNKNMCFDDVVKELKQLKEDALLGKAVKFLIEDGNPDVFYDLQFNDDVDGTIKWYEEQLEKPSNTNS